MSYRLEGPALISVSAGRSSGYLLGKVLEAHGGQLPKDVVPVFADTGKEFPAAHEFLADMERHWGLRIARVEYPRGSHPTPFDALLHDHPTWGLPGPGRHSWCSTELKTRRMKALALSLGWERWTMVLGIRADERHRLASARAFAEKERWDVEAPMVGAGVTRRDVRAFWCRQPFDLRIAGDHEGNCDLCFKKATPKRVRVMREHPEVARWWLQQEELTGMRWTPNGPSYRSLWSFAVNQQVLPGVFDASEDTSCVVCGD